MQRVSAWVGEKAAKHLLPVPTGTAGRLPVINEMWVRRGGGANKELSMEFNSLRPDHGVVRGSREELSVAEQA